MSYPDTASTPINLTNLRKKTPQLMSSFPSFIILTQNICIFRQWNHFSLAVTTTKALRHFVLTKYNERGLSMVDYTHLFLEIYHAYVLCTD